MQPQHKAGALLQKQTGSNVESSRCIYQGLVRLFTAVPPRSWVAFLLCFDILLQIRHPERLGFVGCKVEMCCQGGHGDGLGVGVFEAGGRQTGFWGGGLGEIAVPRSSVHCLA